MELLKHYFPALSNEQLQKFDQFRALFIEWNLKLNLISKKDTEQLEVRHMLHSLSIAAFIQFKAGTRIMDLGCGGGFPGLPLAMFFPDCEFLLVDSIAKKIKAVDDMAQSLELKNVRCVNDRAENVNQKFDFVVSRAVAPMNKLWAWSRNRIEKEEKNALPNGLIALKGGDLKLELNPFGSRILVEEIQKYFKEDFFETKRLVYLRALFF